MEKYEKIRIVGKGAYGTVFLCQQKEDAKLVILKEIPVDHFTPEEKEVSKLESRVLSMLDHPNIVAYYDSFFHDKSLFIVMEYVSGGNLAEYLQQRGEQYLTEEEVLHYFAQLVLALKHIHSQKILHRDLKAQNILLDKRKDVLKITDFGISKILGSNSKALTVVGTPCYISPELCEGRLYDQKSDVWAIGCVLYELLTLKRPFEAATLPALVQKIMSGVFQTANFEAYSCDLRQLLQSLLHVDPARRPTLAQVMAHPVVIAPLYKLYTHLGAIPFKVARSRKHPSLTSSSQISTSSIRSSTVETGIDFDFRAPAKNTFSQQQLFVWSPPEHPAASLDHKDVDFQSVSLEMPFTAALSRSGRAMLWRVDTEGISHYVQCFPDDRLSVNISQVVCGKDFQAFLTSRGILMTLGKGATGCLGHGDYKDVLQPKIVEAILGTDVCQVSCGPKHIMALTSEGLLFAWGQGANGRLGLGKSESFCLPQQVPLREKRKHRIRSIFCGWDCSFLITEGYKIKACGSNRHNKLAMDTENGTSVEETPAFTFVRSHPFDALLCKDIASDKNHTAIITDCGHLYTVGSNHCGQLGWGLRGSTHNMPGKVEGWPDEAYARVACGRNFTVASSAHSGYLYLWGDINQENSNSSENVPSKVKFPGKSPKKIHCLAARSLHIMAAVSAQKR